jgi:Domain of unknown function (DUF4838)
MKKSIATLVCLFIAFYVFAQPKVINIWYTPVQKPSYVWDEYYYNFAPIDLAEDLASLLESSTGSRFKPMPYDRKATEGIFLLLDSTKKNIGNEAATVYSNGTNVLKFSGKYGTGLSYAVYTYLEKLGFKFYLPGKDWTIVPKRTSIYFAKINNEVWKPYFKVRTCFLSGAMHAIKHIDPQANNLKQWNTWYRRNRMGSEYIVMGGHIGEAFNAYNQKELEKDTLILAPINGKRQYSVEAKVDPTYDKGVNMFINWIAEQYKVENKYVASYIPFKTYQSVDPGDGLNYCHSPECMKKFKTISDQVFNIANKAAIKLKQKYPGLGVNLYAYSERSDTPSAKIESNVHVGIVANAFQDVSTAPELVKRWAKKTKHVSIYDYINIGVWNRDQPFFNLAEYFQYLSFVKKQQVEGFSYEAGGSSMAAGIIQYFILKYLSNPYEDVQKEFDTFCTDAFGKAAVPIKKMMQEWYFSNDKLGTNFENVCFNDAELGRFVIYITEAANVSGLTQIQAERINQLKAYIVFLAKYYELKADVEGLYLNKENVNYVKEKTEDILTYTWSLYPSLIFHNTHLNDVFRKEITTSDFFQKWDWQQSDHFNNIVVNKEIKITEAFTEVYEKYKPKAQVLVSNVNAIIEKAYLFRADTVKINVIDASAFGNYKKTINVYCAEPTTISIFYKATPEKSLLKSINDIGFISIQKNDYSIMNDQFIKPTMLNGTITLTLPSKGYYKLTFAQHNIVNYQYTIVPRKSVLYLNNSVIPANGLQVMDNVDGGKQNNKQLAFYTGNTDSINYGMIFADYGNYIHVYNSHGIKKEITDNHPPYRMAFKLKEEEKNTFMYFTTDVYRWPPQFKTTAPYYFFLNFPLRVKK